MRAQVIMEIVWIHRALFKRRTLAVQASRENSHTNETG